MATNPLARLATVDVKGGLWGADLLAALADQRDTLPPETVTAASYGLPSRASTEQTARAAWTTLTAAWDEFTEHLDRQLAVAAGGTYGADSFTWDTWTRHLLDALGYDPAKPPAGGLAVDHADPDDPSDRYYITHIHHDQVPVHALPAGVALDTRSPNVRGASRQSPHSLLQDYLNRTSHHLWGVLTNGLTLRLLRDNAALSRQAYIEFDLAGIFDEGAYADFALLWHAAHATRFTHPDDQPPARCIAETWQDHATSTGVAALEDLRDGVEAAIAEIGQGLIEHPDNRDLRAALADTDNPFDGPAFYRELLYIAYRHVFWFALDDRNLLHPADADRHKVATYRDHYASTVLRGKARAHLGGRHPDGWQHLHVITSWFADPEGCPDLAIPGLLGRLWDPASTPHLNGTTLENRRYYQAIRRLGYITRDGVLHRINYDNMISEELGAVYESLLEIRPVADPIERTFTPDRTAGSDRKKTGSYYTPTSLIKILLDEALDPVLDERIKQAVHELPPDATPEQHQQAQEGAILGTTICDPAMGSAHFLTAAGMRVAKRLAAVRTGEIEPGPGPVHQAFRDVASRCLYGVDVNPMAVELAKLAIWLECHVPGQPLTFLDHHLRHGNALLGVGFDPDLIAWNSDATKAADQGGVPDAAFKPLAGDDKIYARSLRDENNKRRAASRALRLDAPTPHADKLDHLADTAVALADHADDSPQALAAKQQTHAALLQDPELQRLRLRANAWTTCWTMTKTKDATDQILGGDSLGQLPWDVYYDTFFDETFNPEGPGPQAVATEARRLGFFHWYLEFPDITAAGGFSLMLGNPPWEHVELKEKEWFAAAGYGEVVSAKTASRRKSAIAALANSDDPVDRQTAYAWEQDSRDAQTTSEFARNSGRYPLGGVGRVNTYALFADHFAQSVGPTGRIGIIVPTGMITDYTFRDFFATLVDQRRLVAAYDFENKGKRIFPEVHASFRFVTLIATAPGQAPEARFAFMIHDPTELDESDRPYTLTPEQIALVNPNTKTAPVFPTARAAEIVARIYGQHPVLVNHGSERGNPWGLSFRQGLFNVTSRSDLFVSAEELRADGWTPDGNNFVRGDRRMVPLYEGKFFTHYDHRAKDYSKTDPDKLFVSRAYAYEFNNHEDPNAEVWPRYWVDHLHVQEELGESPTEVLLGWQAVTAATNQRTVVAALLPLAAIGNTTPLAQPSGGTSASVILAALFSSFAFDFIARNKAGSTSLNIFAMEQLPCPTPTACARPAQWSDGDSIAHWIASRSAALAASSTLMADALGYDKPIVWNEEQRTVWRTEIDAASFHLFGYTRDEVSYVLDTFPIVARKDRQAEGLAPNDPHWRTKRLILEKYDELSRHAANSNQYVSPNPPPELPGHLTTQFDALGRSRAGGRP